MNNRYDWVYSLSHVNGYIEWSTGRVVATISQSPVTNFWQIDEDPKRAFLTVTQAKGYVERWVRAKENGATG